MRKLLAALAFLLAGSTSSWAQCTGSFPTNTFCGSAGGGTPSAVAFTGVTGNIATSATTASTTTSTGSIVGAGGLGIGGDVWVGGTVSGITLSNSQNLLSSINVINSNAGTSAAAGFKVTTQVANSNAVWQLINTATPQLALNTGSAVGSYIIQLNAVTIATYTKGGGMQIGAPTGGDKGAGTLNATGVFVNGVAAGAFPTATRAGDVIYWNGSIWTNFAGNNSGTLCLSENNVGVPAWSACSAGTGAPGGSSGQVQYNSSATFAGVSGVTSNGTFMTFASGDLKLSGATSGTATLNAPATGGGTATLFAGTDTIAALGTNQTFTGTQTFSGTLNVSGTFQSAGNAMTFPGSTATISALDVAQTQTAAKTFNSGTLKLAGATSGAMILNCVAVCGTGTISFPSVTTDTVALLGLANQVLTGGATVTGFNNGTKSSGTFTPNCGNGPLQYLTNGGAFTLAAPANDSSCDLLSTNNASAGTITFTGFTVSSNVGDPLTTTNGNKFIIHIERINSVSTYIIKALQ